MSKVRESQACPEHFHLAKNAILNPLLRGPKEPAVGGSGICCCSTCRNGAALGPACFFAFIGHLELTAGKDADREELRALLQKHLESEFDANQKSRQAEIERLQQLLGKSKEWLNKRQERRDEIIKKRIEELLRQRELPTPEESSLRR